ncbi:MAG: aldo/keto reductase [Candidatus Xenobiia bacterium LiM19]
MTDITGTAIPTRPLGKTGVAVTQIGLGGEGILRTWNRDREAALVIERALELGITYFDCARAYAGSEEYYGMALGKRREKIFLTSKAFERTKKGALEQLDASLSRMNTGYLNLWQVHDLRTEEDLRQISDPGGALEAFDEARKSGKVLFIGVTAHQDAGILSKALDLFPFDTVLMPVSAAHPHFISFKKEALPKALEMGLGIIGMKVIGGTFVRHRRNARQVEALIRYALSHQISTIVTGCSSPQEVEMNCHCAQHFKPFSEEEIAEMERSLLSPDNLSADD